MHDAKEGVDDNRVRLPLKVLLMLLAMHQQMPEQLLKQLAGEDFVVQIRCFTKSLFEIPQQTKRIRSVCLS